VTHDVAEAVALADRILVIEDGRIAHDVNVDIRARAGADAADLGSAGRFDPAPSAPFRG